MEIHSEWNARLWVCLCAVGMDPPLFNLHSFPSSLILVLLLLWHGHPQREKILTFIAIVAGFLMLFAYAKECWVCGGEFPHSHKFRPKKEGRGKPLSLHLLREESNYANR